MFRVRRGRTSAESRADLRRTASCARRCRMGQDGGRDPHFAADGGALHAVPGLDGCRRRRRRRSRPARTGALRAGGRSELAPRGQAADAAPEGGRLRLLPARGQRGFSEARPASGSTSSKSAMHPLPGVALPPPRFGQEQDIAERPFLGDPDARLQTLLPQAPAFDLAVNLFTFRPGAALPLVEVHVMEHGLLMLEGQGVYRLGDAWYPVQARRRDLDGPLLPAMVRRHGQGPARYLYYKDVNRDPSWS